MGKGSDSLLTYAYTDSERLKEAFFSPPKKKKNHTKKLILLLPIGLIILAVFVVLQYDLVVIPTKNIEQSGLRTSILNDAHLASASLLEKNTSIIKEVTLPIDITFSSQGKETLIINLKKPINLRENELFLYLKKSNSPLLVKAVVKDRLFFSNSLRPLSFLIDAKNPIFGTLKVPINLKENELQNVKLSQITQIKLIFRFPKEENLSYEDDASMQKKWIVIKDLVISKKEEL